MRPRKYPCGEFFSFSLEHISLIHVAAIFFARFFSVQQNYFKNDKEILVGTYKIILFYSNQKMFRLCSSFLKKTYHFLERNPLF